ncbi:MAG: hypothetical protein ACREFF_12335 [Candidatus Udaeobacter sp.]
MSRKIIAFGFAILLVTVQTLFANQVTATLRCDRARYRVGDEITFTVIFRNVSSNSLRFLPESFVYPADFFAITAMHHPTKYPSKHFGFLSVDEEERSNKVVLLKPGEACNISIKGKLTKTLPSYFHQPGIGLFLVFAGSAIKLDRPGQYNIKANYQIRGDDPVTFYLRGSPKLWAGQVTSNTIAIDVTR